MPADLEALIVRPLDYWDGGIETYVNNMVPALADEGIHATVLVCGKMAPRHRTYLESCGARVIEGHLFEDRGSGSVVRGYKEDGPNIRGLVSRVLAEHPFDVVHVHCTVSWMQFLVLDEARKARIPVRLAHSHGALAKGSFAHVAARRYFSSRATSRATGLLACSHAAGRYLFGEPEWERRGIFARNGIDTEMFAFSQQAREKIRTGLPEDTLVIGNVARLAAVKNQSFLMGVFAEVVAQQPNARLWLVGDGPDRTLLEELAASLGLSDKIVFWGKRDDIPALLAGMDRFVLPSHHEGMSIALIEAQASGLPCIVSAGLSDECDIPGCPIEHIPLESGPRTWAEKILEPASPSIRREKGARLVSAAGFDIRDCAHELAGLYRTKH